MSKSKLYYFTNDFEEARAYIEGWGYTLTPIDDVSFQIDGTKVIVRKDWIRMNPKNGEYFTVHSRNVYLPSEIGVDARVRYDEESRKLYDKLIRKLTKNPRKG